MKTSATYRALNALTDGEWHSIPDIVAGWSMSRRASGAVGLMFARLSRSGLASVRYDEGGYWSIAEYKITDAGISALRSRTQGKTE